MPIIENFDGTFDIRDAQDGEIIRLKDGRALSLTVEKVDPRESWLAQRADRDNYFRVIFKTTCARCGVEFTFNRGRNNARAMLPKTCKKHRCLTAGDYARLQAEGTLAQYEEKREHPVKYPYIPEAGGLVSFRNLSYVILAVRNHVSRRTGKASLLLDLAGHCVMCGTEFPCTTPLDNRQLPLRCRSCQEKTGSGWRYNPEKDRGAPVCLGVSVLEEAAPVSREAWGSLREYQQHKQEKADD